jgi:hypothetical protein
MSNSRVLKLVGYWFRPDDDSLPQFPDPKLLVDPKWQTADRGRIASYLRSSPVFAQYLGFSICRFCGERNGTGESTDGEWVWPEGLAHYVEAHSVRLPEEMVSAMRANGWQAPAEVGDLNPNMVDLSFWLAWASRVGAIEDCRHRSGE